jgi:CDP-6-deoxy-D-xylo-4-hexulose-3-dehydrase
MSENPQAKALRTQILELTAEYARVAHGTPAFVPGQSAVPVSGRVYDATDMQSLVESALDFWLTTGRFNQLFEQKLGAFLGVVRGVLTVNSGSSANLVAMSGLTSHLLGDQALKPGDEVITALAGFPTTVNPILQNGLVPVFVDIDIPTYNICAARLEESISDRTRAIMIAHTLGNPFQLDEVIRIAHKYNLRVVEDCCDALGATYDGQFVGTFGDVGTLSFYPAHHITMGEGGAVYTTDPKLRRAMESIRDWGRDCFCEPGQDNTCNRRFDWQLGDLPYGYDHKYIYSHLGYNLKITDMQAAVGVAQMDHLPDFIRARKANFNYLHVGLADLTEFLVLPAATPKSDPSWFGFCLTLTDTAPFSRDAMVRYLNSQKIGTRFLFGGNLLRQPYMKDRPHRIVGGADNANIVAERTFWIGVYPGLEQSHLDFVIDRIRSFVGQHSHIAK